MGRACCSSEVSWNFLFLGKRNFWFTIADFGETMPVLIVHKLEGRNWLRWGPSRIWWCTHIMVSVSVSGFLCVSQTNKLRSQCPVCDRTRMRSLQLVAGFCRYDFTLIGSSLYLGKAQALSAPVTAQQVLQPCSLLVKTKPGRGLPKCPSLAGAKGVRA